MKIWHNNRCSKSRNTLSILEEKKANFEVVNYLENPPTEGELKDVLKMLGIKAQDLVRKSEEAYKANYKGKELDEEGWISAMLAHPKLIERPIVINNGKAVIGRPPENVLTII
jgi:arsenate reductase